MTRDVKIHCDLCGTEPNRLAGHIPPNIQGISWMQVTVYVGEPMITSDLCPVCAALFSRLMKQLGPAWVQHLIAAAPSPPSAISSLKRITKR
jgi:hypothetical protein